MTVDHTRDPARAATNTPAVTPPASPSDAVGYGKPPVHTRFAKGECGNPRGRPRSATPARAEALVLKEAYRRIRVREGDKVSHLPAIQAVMRSQVALAVKGHSPAQRAIIATIQALEHKRALEAEEEAARIAAEGPRSYIDSARRIAYILNAAFREKGKKMPDNLMDAIIWLIGGGDPPKRG